MKGSRREVGSTLALGVACFGFVLDAGTNDIVLGVVAVGAVLPWPLPFALGQVGAAVVFGGPVRTLPFAVVQAGLWAGLAISTGHLRRGGDARSLVAAGVVAIGLVALAVTRPGLGSLLVATTVTAATACILYGIHRYERVRAGLVDR